MLRVDPEGAAKPATPQGALAVAAPSVAARTVDAPHAVVQPVIVPPAAALPVVVQAAHPVVDAVAKRAYVNVDLRRLWPISQLPFQNRCDVTQLVYLVQAVTRAGAARIFTLQVTPPTFTDPRLMCPGLGDGSVI